MGRGKGVVIFMRQIPKPGEIYKHFKGNCYRIITLALHADTGEKLIVYQALYGSYRVYVRELSMFMGPVDRAKYPDASQKMRFELVESGAASLKTASAENGAADSKAASAESGAAGSRAASAESSAADSKTASAENSAANSKAASAENGAVSSKAEQVKGAEKGGGDGGQAAPDATQLPQKETEPKVDPMVLAYLDADTCREKLQILTSMKSRLTDRMINTMAIAIDVEIKPGDITERYEELKYCLAMRERFECRRIR